MAVDYTPSFDPADVDSDYGSTGGDITVPTFTANMKPFRFWCQRALPLVYDDSLSYYEVLCKVVDQMNGFLTDLQTATGSIEEFAQQFVVNQTFLNNMATKLGQDVDTLEAYINDRMDDFTAAYQQLQSYVNNYFDNLDVQTEINNKLDEMADDGTFNTLFNPVITAWMTEKTAQIDSAISNQDAIQAQQNARISVLEGRMDGFSSLPSGSTSGNAELLDIRTNFLGETYPSAGDAVRASDMISSGFQSIGFTRLTEWNGNEESSVYDTIVIDVAAYKGGHVVVIANMESFVQSINDGIGIGLYGSNVAGKTVDANAASYPFPDGFSGITSAVFKNYSIIPTSIQGVERVLVQLSIPSDFSFQYLKLGNIEKAGSGEHTTPFAIVYATSWSKTPVDNTLSIAGDAADAKATGDAISLIDDHLEAVGVSIPYTLNNGYIAATGSIGAMSTNQKEKYTSIIPVSNGDILGYSEQHTIEHSLWIAYALYNANDEFISRTVVINNTNAKEYNTTITVNNPDAKGIAFTFRSFDDAIVTVSAGSFAKLPSLIDGISLQIHGLLSQEYLTANGYTSLLDLPIGYVYSIAPTITIADKPADLANASFTFFSVRGRINDNDYTVLFAIGRTVGYFALRYSNDATIPWVKINNNDVAATGTLPIRWRSSNAEIVLLGDSIVQGVGSSDYSATGDTIITIDGTEFKRNTGSKSWGAMFKAKLESQYYGLTVINNGLPGQGINVITDNLDSLVTANTKYAIVCAGINNRMGGATTVLNYYTALIAALKAKNIEVIALSPIDVNGADYRTSPALINTALEKACTESGALYYNLYGEYNSVLAANNKSDYYHDTLHPNDKGYVTMYGIICKLLNF